ncbi:MAG: hypothetical protein ACJAXD_002508, partial [Cryomorphaceae bacterium]
RIQIIGPKDIDARKENLEKEKNIERSVKERSIIEEQLGSLRFVCPFEIWTTRQQPA